MNRPFIFILFAAVMIVAPTLGAPPHLSAQSGTSLSELGNPPPGALSDQESTEKKRNPAKDHSPDMNAQITMGGAKSMVYGKIQTIDGQSYQIKDEETGDEVRVKVNQDTNLDCSEGAGQLTSDRLIQSREGTRQQEAQGQRKDETAVGSGFKSGDCTFKSGDRIKVEVSDMGTVTTMKLLSNHEKEPGFEPRKFGDNAALDMTASGGTLYGQYVVLPVPLGSFKEKSVDSELSVKSPDGHILGSVQTLIMDTRTGHIEYAVIRLSDYEELTPVPWSDLKMQRDQDVLIFKTSHYQLQPDVTANAAQDRSPEITRIVKDMAQSTAPADLRSGDETIKNRSAVETMPADKKGERLRGQVASIEGPHLTIKERSGKEVRLHMDQNTDKGQTGLRDDPFKVGDAVEAYVSPKGHALSITLLRPQSGVPGDH